MEVQFWRLVQSDTELDEAKFSADTKANISTLLLTWELMQILSKSQMLVHLFPVSSVKRTEPKPP